ncbi:MULTISPECIES: glycoside hydrolase family 65 protein [unclassified Enterococcus]|uniref:glycoside hydrolase family 65 protein n=1 Tax=unclassified Enterococcus TaxID=2608891 RepID=UPI001CE062B8|nr:MULTISPECIES: glycoside hydrolase family 65 protein [unclassified Enterococcus]MCA5013707.1 glycoside hydrolase family 65 protein [Enterococcus sp. S23]MCA5016957.1 glycoside hydrolase family 65 protein [Enterococcus sp. S22(2020)]
MNDFILTLEDIGNRSVQNIETLFAQANGALGVRASLPIKAKESTPGTFLNAFYESHDIVYGENAYGYAKQHQTMVNLFDLRSIELSIDDVSEFLLVDQSVVLDMKKGILKETYLYQTKEGKTIEYHLESFTSHFDRTVYAQKIDLKALNFSGEVEVSKKAQKISTKQGEDFDPRIKDASVELIQTGNKYTAPNSGLSFYTHFDSYDKKQYLEEGQTLSFTQLYQISREAEFTSPSYEELEAKQIAIFADFWASSDIEIDGDRHLQKGIRFNLYHLFNSAGRDGHSNFCAKGLTGEGYEGHYFWDTEMYLLPFFIYTQPEIAKSLLSYRVNILPKAQARAKELGFKGALFAWRTINGEETSAYYPAGTAQVHINADIAFAFELYEKVTGDTAFIDENCELIFETARFWLDYGFMSKRGFEIHEVTGPDEYTALVNNNYYTNKMAQNHLYYAARLAKKLKKYEKEAVEWFDSAEKMYIGFDQELQITQQDDSFLMKEPWDFEHTPKDRYPLLLHFHPMKIYKHQVLKQADTILAHMLFDPPIEQIARDFDFYEPLTTHDSSLSKAIYGVVASKLGRSELAYRFFKEAAIMDLEDFQGNASHGIHAANMGGSWLGLIYGFAGLSVENGKVTTKNHLPKEIKSLKFTVTIRGIKQQLVIDSYKK